MTLTLFSARAQAEQSRAPFDCWVTPDGLTMAEFYRLPCGFLVRFPDKADFEISEQGQEVSCWPVQNVSTEEAQTLFNNAIAPIIGNHNGGLFLHGSAVRVGEKAIAFLGHSRSGKTTLAGAMAKHGYPFLTEDVIDLALEHNEYWISPKQPRLRLFKDSAEYLHDRPMAWSVGSGKKSIGSSDQLPFSDASVPLSAIFLLGADHEASLRITQLGPQVGLTELLRHAFILDVEDRSRLRAHFSRLAKLSQRVVCNALDYPRDYEQLPDVVNELIAYCGKTGGLDAAY